jgi:signal transduction histidine kinase
VGDVSNVIRVPSAIADRATPPAVQCRIGAESLEDLATDCHAVQFYENDAFLLDTVADFLACGLDAGDQALVIASEAHRQGLMQRLESRPVGTARGRLELLDAHETLAKFMVGDAPDPDRFRAWIASVIAEMTKGHRGARILAFGEMVDLLWRSGRSRAAIDLEELWNEARREHSFSLFCAYLMGSFYREGDETRFLDVCRTHSHVLPTERFAKLDDAGALLREISVLQQRGEALEREVRHRKELENVLREALAERGRVAEQLRASVERERRAREQAEASDAFKEMFLGVLGHDLRNPLNTILTTTRLMTMRGELSGDSQRRLERVVDSGERIGRMIDQLLDLTCARLGGGIVVKKTPLSLVPIVSNTVDEFRTASPGLTIDFCTDGPCEAHVDRDRFEQVVSTFLSNALKHGDPEKPIRVALVDRDRVVSLRVRNEGKPIDPALLSSLFEPFKPGPMARSRSDGLGLGLYISERIVHAHGGKVAVESSLQEGTCFEATFPESG